jgi:hypothetical protein
MMGHILHDWDLEQKKMLIRKAYDAVPKGGALVVYESIIDDDRSKNSFGLLMSLNMLIETPGGFDYTGADCIGWMKEAGFTNTRVEHLIGPDSMVIGIKYRHTGSWVAHPLPSYRKGWVAVAFVFLACHPRRACPERSRRGICFCCASFFQLHLKHRLLSHPARCPVTV